MSRRALCFAIALGCGFLSAAAPVLAQSVRIETVPQRNVFVGTELVKIDYTILVTTGVAVRESDLREADVSPFTLESVTVGERIAIPERKDEAFIRVLFVVRPPADLAFGTHTLPAIEVGYYFNQVQVSGMTARQRQRERIVTTEPIELEKVHIYAETDLLHEVTRIGDESVATLGVHMDAATVLHNDRLPETPLPDVAYLSEPVFKEPLTLLGTDRTERAYDTHRIISYRYRFSVMDVPAKSVQVPFTAIQWGMNGRKQSEVQTIAVGPGTVRVTSILDTDTPFEPMKSAMPESTWEMYAFWWAPLAAFVALVICLAGLGLHEAVAVFRAWRTRKRDTRADEEWVPNLPVPVYERNPWRRLWVVWCARRALAAFNASPDMATCAALRNLAARSMALRAKGRISRQEACTMTADALASIARGTAGARWLSVIRALDEQLARRRYHSLTKEEALTEAAT